MPFPEPETALASTIGGADEENFIRRFIVRPAASWRASACFQSLTPRLNNLQIFSTTYGPGQIKTLAMPSLRVPWRPSWFNNYCLPRESQPLIVNQFGFFAYFAAFLCVLCG